MVHGLPKPAQVFEIPNIAQSIVVTIFISDPNLKCYFIFCCLGPEVLGSRVAHLARYCKLELELQRCQSRLHRPRARLFRLDCFRRICGSLRHLGGFAVGVLQAALHHHLRPLRQDFRLQAPCRQSISRSAIISSKMGTIGRYIPSLLPLI